MAFGILLMFLFGLLAVGILILIIGVLVLGIRRISKMGKNDEKQIPAKTDADITPESANPRGISSSSSEKSPDNPPQN